MRFLVIAVLLMAAPAHGATFAVTTTADSGVGSLRQAMLDASADAAPPHTIRFEAPFPQGGVIELQTTLPTWSNDRLTFEGNGLQPVLDGRNAVRILVVDAGTHQITVQGITFRRGRSIAGAGGCIWYQGAPATTNLFVYDSRFESCVAVRSGGDAFGGAVAWQSPDSTVQFSDSHFANNGAVVVGNSTLRTVRGGAVMMSGHSLLIVRSVFHGNSVERIGGQVMGAGGAVYMAPTKTGSISWSDFVANRVIDAGPEFSAGGAVLMDCQGDVCGLIVNRVGFVDNSITGEEVGGGALATRGGTLYSYSTSFSDNRAPGGHGGALLVLQTPLLTGMHMSFKDNAAAHGSHVAMSQVAVSRWTWNLLGPAATGAGPACVFFELELRGDVMNNLYEEACDPLSTGASIGPVGPLALDWSSSPLTLAPGAGSPAIDPLMPEIECGYSDARGVLRPQDGDGDGIARCDVGAYEVQFQRPELLADGFEALP